MITAINPAIDQTQIMKLVDHWAEAIRTKNIDGRMSNYAPNVSMFDVVEPSQYSGVDCCKKSRDRVVLIIRGAARI
jgi:ketosteroid isomerase-like protein